MNDSDVVPTPGAAPGTLQPPPGAEPVTLRAIGYSTDTKEEKSFDDFEELRSWRTKFTTIWVEVHGTADVDRLSALGAALSLHPLVLEDVVNVGQRSKVEEYEDALFIIVNEVRFEDGELQREQLALYLSEGLVVSFQPRPSDSLNPVRVRVRRGRPRMRNGGASYLGYAILDLVVDEYYPLLLQLEEELEDIEDRLLQKECDDQTSEIHEVRRKILGMRKVLLPMREAISQLHRTEIVFTAETQPYVRDCLDHVLRLVDGVDACRDFSGTLMDLQTAATSERMNDIMRVLTIIATIFIPVTFISSVYGMNFDPARSALNMPELGWKYGYVAALGAMLSVGLGFLWWFQRKGWLR